MCPGPLIWYHITDGGALLECACCGFINVTGNYNDAAHAETPLVRSPA
jgi:hypothetical protein